MTSTAVVTQLRALEHLTRSEIALARTRVAQARTDRVRRDLEDNARKAESRSEAIAQALRDLDAVPDVVAPVVGWAVSLAKSAAEQAQPIDEALLGDLAIEHQLADRARYLLALTANGPAGVHRLAERLVAAHTETIEWLQTVVAEEAVDGVTSLKPTPLQAVAAGVTKAVQLPVRLTVGSVNRAAHEVARAGHGVQERLSRTGDRFGRVAFESRDVLGTGLTSGFDAATRRAEAVAKDEDAAGTAGAAHAVRRETGSLKANELPIRDYDGLSVRDVTDAVGTLEDPKDVRAIEAYEERNRNRNGVLRAVRERAEVLAKDAARI
ncbi:ferritin-like domain-containing protein [Pseudonocardia pini]|uniref:ferritin-like domain-containing protein n=1 Tax=Pseudonocardia pini TaxID=2758030 RepID=UPI0015EFEF63|nr:ferritin-like domain-containing protein [Pseudonocardia pini]